ncbi:IST1 homolog [Jatropha curcas]|uniref:IST1 homolog n=1 Tax=Jatropha curcas TaxID=180498 RepID=UPI0005FBBC6E|nr:IST1 homolog [Jatropha curcas]
MEALLNFVLGRKLKTSKLKTLTKLAIARATIFKNQRQVLYSHAKFDVAELLKLGHQERALIRAEHVIKEQNMMDVFTMIEDYCYLLLDRVMLLKKDRECHEELKEAISSLIFASSRCAEFPELQQLRWTFVTRFGKEFAARAVELRNNCGVSPKIIQKLSTRRPSLESRLKVLQYTASENGIVLHLVEDEPAVEEKREAVQKQKWQESYKSGAKWYDTESEDETYVLTEELMPDEKLSASLKPKKKYRDVAAAALEAFESAAYAAAAARVAVELSRPKSLDMDQDDHGGSSNQGRYGYLDA